MTPLREANTRHLAQHSFETAMRANRLTSRRQSRVDSDSDQQQHADRPSCYPASSSPDLSTAAFGEPTQHRRYAGRQRKQREDDHQSEEGDRCHLRSRRGTFVLRRCRGAATASIGTTR